MDTMRSLPESHGSVAVPRGGGFWRKLLAFIGPGWLVAVGYMDPGNWATDIAGGSAFGYALLSVVLLSNLMAIVLQALAARLGIGSGLDLAQACRAHYPRRVTLLLWVLCEIAIVACDLAEVLGTAIALKLLFGLPLVAGVCLTALDVFLILALQRFGFRRLEAFIAALLIVIAGCFALELAWAGPDWRAAARGLVPTAEIVRNPAMLYIAIGILGATVMPHNLYLHSAVVQTRAFGRADRDRREAIRLATIDSTVSLGLAFFINAAILVLAAATFHVAGRTGVAEIEEAHRLLAPMLGVGAASTVFAIALLASGQNSTVTGTLAGQVVMEGFLDLRLPMWLRRLVTRGLALVPAVAVVVAMGDRGTTPLLLLSQVILSMQLPFAVIPLVTFSGNAKVMGAHVAPRWLIAVAWVVAALIVALNAVLLWGIAFG
ncbi:divalent metal cation transporter [Sphingomonas sp. CL5.1]|uniref:Nramp family divalent metal transporter n=1 Tax=Sphingomonas sp. CL5.1 TaxID=2653203 RepID=UPI00158430C6|nr:Nramp family divalent metal transporter [Sphingomonas sp. CL5.1]QKS01591.1 divalent metal cation transporter [Sphingomonas sp. CL5.1]